MPIYEYLCGDCRARFERYVRAFGEPVACQECGSSLVEKQLSRFALSSGATSGAPPASPRGGCCGGGCGCAH